MSAFCSISSRASVLRTSTGDSERVRNGTLSSDRAVRAACRAARPPLRRDEVGHPASAVGLFHDAVSDYIMEQSARQGSPVRRIPFWRDESGEQVPSAPERGGSAEGPLVVVGGQRPDGVGRRPLIEEFAGGPVQQFE